MVRQLGRETGVKYKRHTQEEIDAYINESRQSLNDAQEVARENRKLHLNNLAEKYARENKLKNKTAVQELLGHESIRTTFELLRGKLKKHSERTTRLSLDCIRRVRKLCEGHIKEKNSRRHR